MKSSTTPDFWTSYRNLPTEIQSRARTAYRLWRANPRHPFLRFKKVGELWSVRIGSGYRALALLQDDTFFWFWIGTHDETDGTLALAESLENNGLNPMDAVHLALASPLHQ